MEIKVLGPGCAKCKTTYNVIEKVIKENNLEGGRHHGNGELQHHDDSCCSGRRSSEDERTGSYRKRCEETFRNRINKRIDSEAAETAFKAAAAFMMGHLFVFKRIITIET